MITLVYRRVFDKRDSCFRRNGLVGNGGLSADLATAENILIGRTARQYFSRAGFVNGRNNTGAFHAFN